MVRVRLKKLTALLLSIAMVLSMFTNLLPAAIAEGEGGSTPSGDQDYNDIVTSRQPGLYVDFLGDNRNYVPGADESATGAPTGGKIKAPGLVDQNAVTNSGGSRTWTGYKQGEVDAGGDSIYYDPNVEKDTIFWIGVGIDKMDELDLFKQGSDGIYSLELGFFYNNTFIEPYTGLTGEHTEAEIQQAYQSVIEDANLSNYAEYRWNNYHIVSAETGLRPQTDVVTQEIISGPNMNTIMAPDVDETHQNSWRMTYVAIERDEAAANRDLRNGSDDTRYLLVIPFRLKAFDPQYKDRLCLRLVRNAGMFSIGGGEDGVSPYAAWERVTTRNPGRELKLMTNFQGDLNIFDARRIQDELYDATLVLDDGGSTDNKAVLSVDGDPSAKPVSVNADGQSITNLPAGTGMKLDVTLQTGYSVTVKVYLTADSNKPDEDKTFVSYTEVWKNDKGTYTFVMPNADVTVEVMFGITDNTEFNLYLDEDHDGEDPVLTGEGAAVEGNGTILVANYPGNPAPADGGEPIPAETVTVDKDSPTDNALNLPGEKMIVEAVSTNIKTELKVDISLHEDYYALVEIYSVANKGNLQPSSWTGNGITINSATNTVTVPYTDSQLVLDSVPQSDIIVRVTYLPATRVEAKLEVWHQNVEPKDTNVAQLWTPGYNDKNEGMPAYSGVVYQNDMGTTGDVTDDDHSAVKLPFRVLEQVEKQAAQLSGSLGGDGNIPVPWAESIPEGETTAAPDPNSMMAQLYQAASGADLAGKVNAYDLRKLTGLTGQSGKDDGLRKNSRGEYYADSEMTEFYTRLLEVKALADEEIQAAADAGTATPSGVGVVEVPDPQDPTKVLFSYYNLTPDQIQAYLLDYEKYLSDKDTDPTVSKPVLRSAADAAAEVAKCDWYDPSENHDTRPPTSPETGKPGYTLETRVGRQMAVVLEANSAYTVLGGIEILDAADRTPLPVAVTQDPDYQNVYLFNVPDRDYIVKVTYVERKTHPLSLSISVVNGKEEPGNVTKATAFVPDPDPTHTAAKRVTLETYQESVTPREEKVLEGSIVTVVVKKIPGYKASAQVVYGPGDDTVGTNPGNVTDLADGAVFTFRMPTDEAKIQITYTRDVRTNNANIILVNAAEGGNSAVWEGTTSTVKPGVPEGDKLKAVIDVRPGYYILSAEAYTADSAYPFTLSGNGWNNGQGGVMELDTIMPNQEYFVRITFAKGPPPEEDSLALTLQVMDPDNEEPYVDNRAWAQAGTVKLGPVGLVASGVFPTPAGAQEVPGSANPDTKTVKAGETVTVEYEVQQGYALDSIVLEPAGLGITPTYITKDGKIQAQFVMPAASATVVVTFRKEANIKPLFLHLNKTEDGKAATQADPGDLGNKISWVKSDTFDRNENLGDPGDRRYNLTTAIPATVPDASSAAATTGVARPGERVRFDVQTAPGWYIHSVTLTNRYGSRLNYTMTEENGETVVTYIMPASDVTAIVNYRKGTAPDPTDPEDPRNSDRLLELLVLDPDNVGSGDPLVYVDNWADADVTGATTVGLGPLGLGRNAVRDEAYVKSGDLVTLHYRAQDGYTLDVITVTTDGAVRTITPVYTAAGTAQFTMPNANVTVVVRFREVTEEKPEKEYTANLILHMPAGVAPADYDKVGEGSFVYNGYGVFDYINNVLTNKSYSRTAKPGEKLDFTAWAKDGYYIQRVSVTPAALGVGADFSGAFGLQEGSLVMPAADVQVNVFFVKLDKGTEWPEEVPYRLNLEVYDASGLGSTANFGNIAGTDLVAPDNGAVGNGERKTLMDYNGGTQIHEEDRVSVALKPAEGAYVRSITVTDSRGRNVPWNYVPGGIAFDMPPAHVTVTVHYARRSDEIDNGRKHNVTLYIYDAKGNDMARLDAGAQFTDVHGGKLTGLFAGDTVTLTATPDPLADPYHSVASAYAVVVDASGGRPVVIPMSGLLDPGAQAGLGGTTQTGMPLVARGGRVQFAMPDADAEVYVTFIDGGLPRPDELTASLMVMGPNGSGSAEMIATAGSKLTTGNVAASGGGTLFAPEGTELTVDLHVNPGYAISSIRVVDERGNKVSYTWTSGAQDQFKLNMPDGVGVRVYVELEKVDTAKELTVQVVVNNGGGAGNTAKLRLEATAVGNGVAILRPVHALDEIFLDLTVQTGYRIGSIQVVPAKFGIAPSLNKKDTENQTTSFTMPGEDLVVYVHFESDNRLRRTATLVTEGHYHENNNAKIHSDFSGWSRDVSPTPSTATGGFDRTSVQAAPATATDPAEWVTVNYEWDESSAVDHVTVTYSDGITEVPFTQNEDLEARKGEITFPMVDSNVIITVHYKNDPTPTTYDAVLHVIDMDTNTEITGVSWASLTWKAGAGSPTTGQVTALAPFPGNEKILKVPAGQIVTVDADTVGAGVYLWAGYVIYRQGGQMIRFEFDPDDPGPGFTGAKTDTFVMHPGRNDVYVYFTKTKPNETDYSAVLMVDSPAADKKSFATMTTSGDAGQKATVVANTDPDHGYIVATKGDTITVVVTPDVGYTVDSILMTPLGVKDENGIPIVPTQVGNVYSFTMPAQNVAIRVKLKISSAGDYVATLHYGSVDGDDGYTPEQAKAILGYDTVSTDVNGGQLKVDENTTMDLSVCLSNEYLVLSAYVLKPNGEMVPLADSLEGVKDVNPGTSAIDGATTFVMPASNVDVYVWFTKKAPADRWRTAVLTVTDEKGTDRNSGLNSARFWTGSHPDDGQEALPHLVVSGGVPTHGFFWVKEGEQVTVKINPPAAGYTFSHPATITHSISGAGAPTLTENDQGAPEYIYTYNVGACNSAVHAHFVSSNITQNPLTVVAIDKDNPGGDQNVVEVQPGGNLPQLTLVSTTSSGARQRIPSVVSDNRVNFTIKPAPGYTTVAHLIVNGVRRPLVLTGNSGGFNMPDSPATLEVTFMKDSEAFSATLSIVDTRDPNGVTTNVSIAQMAENAFDGRVTANSGPATAPAAGTEKGVFPVLPNGTELMAWVDTLAANTRVIGGVLITNQGSQVLPATTNGTTGREEYLHTLAGRDAEIRILVEPEPTDPADRTYIASVGARNLPAGTKQPTIVADPVNPMSGSSWTGAKAGNGIEVTLDVPYGYRADLTVDGTGCTLSSTSIDGTDGAVTDAKVTLQPSMPARNVHITVTYVRTRFDATVATGGNGQGTATLSDGTTTATATSTPLTTQTIPGVKENTGLPYTAVPEGESQLTDGFWVTDGGITQRVDPLDSGTLTMPADDATYTAIFQDKNDIHHKAYVVVEDPAHLPLNKAIDIVNTTVDMGGGRLYAFGDGTHVMETSFTTEPGYYAVVTAVVDGTTTPVSVVQQGFTGAGTATLVMPSDVDVKVTITYTKDLPDREWDLSLRLVGADGQDGNNAKLTGGAADIERRGTPDYDIGDASTKAKVGTDLYLDINRYRDNTIEYYIEKVTVQSGGVTVTYTPPNNNVNEYGTNATSLFTMPDGNAVVTVYYRLPYKATLFVVDAAGVDYLGDTKDAMATNVPDTTMAVTNTAGVHVAGSPTTLTHEPIEGLYGTETVTTTVDEATLPTDTSVASVIASTSSGTVHLIKDGSGNYIYPMSTPTRAADDVDITVILRDKTKPDMYTATVYKVGHDNYDDNWASITNTTTAGLPFGTKAGNPDWHDWTGAYEGDFLRVDVTTHTGYYAVVTAVRTGTTTPVPVLQWAPTGTAANPATAQFYMPAADVDVTVKYSTTPPEAFLELVLEGHNQVEENGAEVYDATAVPGTLIPPLDLDGGTAADTDPLRATSTDKVKAGTKLEAQATYGDGYYVESITMTVPGFAPIALTVTLGTGRDTASTQMPVITGTDHAVITVKLAQGQKSPRPFDPTHSTIYNGTLIGGDYPTPPTDTDPGNPNLSDPDQEGWLLAEVSEDQENTIVVTIPTLYDVPDDTKVDTLYDAGVDETSTADPKPVPPVYTFYWVDNAGVEHVLDSTQMTVSDPHSLTYDENPKGDYPAGTQHYGYQVTLTAKPGTDLETYIRDGGTIYVTAKKDGEAKPGVPWAESEKTQVIIPAPDYTATLYIVDVSSSLNNEVTMYVKDDPTYLPVNVDGGQIKHLHGKETLLTDVVMGDPDVKVVSVLAIPKEGSPSYLALELGHYPFPMVRDDVDIVVTLANEVDEIYTATVVKEDPANDPGNTVKISNPTHPVLNRDTSDPARWTLAYAGDEIRVDAVAAPGYRAVVTAVRKDTNESLRVMPEQGAGTMVVTLPDKMPASNIEITVTFVKVEAPDQRWVTLRVRMDSENGPLPVDPANRAEALAVGGTEQWKADSVNGYTDTQLMISAPVNMDINTILAEGYAVQEWFVDGVLQTVLGTNLNVTIPIPAPAGISNTVITVVLKETKVEGRTPRPFDPAHSNDYLDAEDHINHDGHTGHTGSEGHQNGYLMAKNLGSSRVQITVPNLYDGELYAAENVAYTLYARINGQMVKLLAGGDYDTVIPVAPVGVTHTANGKTDWEGQVFTIQSLDPASALGEYVKNGGVIYITATAPGEDESTFTEVILPADPNKDTGYTVTLKVIDDTTGKHNEVRMQNANSGVIVPWVTGGPTLPNEAGHISGLLGGELIRTEVAADTGVSYTVMAHTESMGDVLLFPHPDGTIRYPKDMPTENMDVIVHFRAEDSHIHIAAVEKRGATAVEGNEAFIENMTDNTLRKGDIWTEGRTDEHIQVKVTTAEGYYATVSMSYIDPIDGPVNKTMVVLGSGTPEAPLLVDFDMPDADVQVTVLFEKGQKSPRPYDPEHSEAYYGDQYQHNTPADQSTTHQEGWLLGENLGGGQAVVTIPTLWSEKDGLENADNADFTFYLKDEDGNLIRLTEGKDYTLANVDPDDASGNIFTPVTNTYQDAPGSASQTSYTGVTFLLVEEPSTDGYTSLLEDLLDSGLSLFVSATKRETAIPPWVEGDVTELVIPSTGLRPFDPDRENDPDYNDHWIRAENRGDYLIVTVPLLNSPREDDPTEVDDAIHRFQLHLQVDGEDRTSEIVNVTDLLKFSNVRGYDHPSNVNTLYDPDWIAGQDNGGTPDQWEEYYENDIYNDTYLKDQWAEGEEKWHGARFIVEINREAEDPNGLIPILEKIFDNDGTMNGGETNHRMYITSDETESVTDKLPEFRTMDYVDFEVPQYYSLIGAVESYAPKHTATYSLYRFAGGELDNREDYEEAPAFVHRQFREKGMGLWQLNFAIKSSELMGDDRSGVTYKLVIEKPGHVVRTWTNVELTEENLDPDNALCFTVVELAEKDGQVVTNEVIPLFGGDVNQDGYARMEDYVFIMSFFNGSRTWSNTKDPDDPDWHMSVYNPESMAHQVDLDGDGFITVSDSAIWNDYRNYNKNETDYAQLYLVTSDLSTAIQLYQEQLLLEAALLLEQEQLEELDPEEELPPVEEELPPTEGELPDGEEPSQPEEPDEGQEPSEEGEKGEEVSPPEPELPPEEGDKAPEEGGTGSDAETPSEEIEPLPDGETDSGSSTPGEQVEPELPSVEGTDPNREETTPDEGEGSAGTEMTDPDSEEEAILAPLVDEKEGNNRNSADTALEIKEI